MTASTELSGTESPATMIAADDADQIPILRTQVDAMDAAILRLVTERIRLSQRIQTARINDGGPRVELGRERVVLDAYRKALGNDGPLLADAVLRVCRGSR
jgi:chorismate mutase